MSLLPLDDAQRMARGLGAGEVFAESRQHCVVEVSDGEVRVARHRNEQGIGVRRSTVDGCTYRSVPGLDLDALSSGGGRPAPIEPLEMAGAVALARATEEAALRTVDGPRAEVLVRVVRGQQRVLVARPDAVVEETRTYAALHVHVTVTQGTMVRRCRRSVGASDIDGIIDHLRLAEDAARGAVRQLEAVPAPSGEFPVVLGPGGPAMLLHEACGHALEADLADRPGSAYGALLGQRVAAPIVSLVDDPGLPGDAPLYTVDDEGEPATPTWLVENGILRDHLRDRQQAARTGRPANGHGRRLGYAYPPIARMASTVVAQGTDDPDEIIRDTPCGIYVRAIGGGDTDMGSGRFNLQVEEGFLIEHGRLTAPLRGAMLSGHGPRVLAAIDRVGHDLAVLGHTYLCGKLDQFPLVVNLGQPTIRVSGLHVWGG